MTEDTDSKLLPAETKLAAAVNQGIMCRLVSSDTNQEPDRKLTLEDMQKWSDDHVIRASFLKKLLDRNQNTSVHVSGAIIDGALFLTGQQIHILYLEKCFIRGEVHADGMKAGSLTFINCVFSAHVGLVASTVDAFAFTGCTTLRPVWFRDSIWGSAMFDNTELLAKAWFDHMIVTGRATFTEGQFHDVDFSGSRFLNDATFTGTHFSGEARFTDAVAQTWNFNGAQFDDPNPGLWTGNNIDLSDTTFRKRGHLTVMAKTVTARRLRSIEGTQLSVRSETLDLTEADFQGPSIVTSYQLDESDRVAFPIPLDTLDSFPLAKDIREYAINRSNAFTEQIVNTVRQIPGCELRSLRRASVAKLALTKVSLGNCRFADAHNLEQIRIGHECTFHRPRRLLRTRRDTIAEEDLWRESRR
ncbi:pentapeptide repeat-containing protein, partial [Nocardia sp. 852002-51244_SCH5132740]